MKHLHAILPLLILIACTRREPWRHSRTTIRPSAETSYRTREAPASCVEAQAETRRAVDIIMSIDQSGEHGGGD